MIAVISYKVNASENALLGFVGMVVLNIFYMD
jgi:hypothetical protein